ncbi:MAG: ATP-binding protein [Deltaproteobacteria bacterium]|nr:ATP-binding protein [Deltaproteobacteria bacterium]MBW2052302.1 ATP-binding protein [Deltaproteobacteria bacterium]MBW2139758.1 ATP-binding protein [Deltaproteobacteria bacterium]MBW2323003.1 ATP-binding protein [Deltaproteobacteria bacterium]
MIIALASGKGGTGKTTVCASLVRIWDKPVQAVDLDVEEPNLALYLKPELSGRLISEMEIPVSDQEKCTACGACSEICQFKAITVLGEYLLTFPEMCHGCGGCLAVCPEGALSLGARELGEVLWGQAGEIDFLMGRLRVGEAMSPPLMRDVKKRLDSSRDVIIDAPPGTSCPAINAVKDADVIVLVTEPTPFGFYDLKLAREAFTPIGKPMGVVMNRTGFGDAGAYDYCRATGLPILLEIPYDRRVAEKYSQGEVIADALPEFRGRFIELAARIRELAAGDLKEVSNG